jgi:HD-GYP domain-containing protein (c-di-GMP phosphodiesterase class II)
MAESTLSDRVRTAEIIAALSLATDVAVGFPFEHGLRSTLVAMRLCDRLGVDSETATQTYFFCLLFYVGCTAPVDVGWEVFGDDNSFHTYALPVRFGGVVETVQGFARAVAPPTEPGYQRVWRLLRHLPGLAVRFSGVTAATCEVARMLTDELGLSRSDSRLATFETERWDGWGFPNRIEGAEIPLAVRIVQVARDATFQHTLYDSDSVASLISERAGKALDPEIAGLFASEAASILEIDATGTAWEHALAAEPKPWSMLEGTEIDRALAAMGHFADIGIADMVGHSTGVSDLSRTAAELISASPAEQTAVRRAALVHDLGRVSVSSRIWEKASVLTSDDWERVRLHAYHTERILLPSPFLAALAPIASFHHERNDGSGYHRGVGTPLEPLASIVAAADAYHAMTETRPYRPALSPAEAAGLLAQDASTGRLGSDAVKAVLEAAGHRTHALPRPAGLTEREAEVVSLLARGLLTKQIASRLQISAKTADHHIQNAYRKMGVSTRAGATLFAMQHGLTWVNSP